MKIYYEHHLKEKSRMLRNNPTQSEKLLWNFLKGRKLMGYQFSRQKPIGKYIADFFSSALNLVIEIDGESHAERSTEDAKRQLFLENLGLLVLRFDDEEVKSNAENVIKRLTEEIRKIEKILEK